MEHGTFDVLGNHVDLTGAPVPSHGPRARAVSARVGEVAESRGRIPQIVAVPKSSFFLGSHVEPVALDGTSTTRSSSRGRSG
ncbi:MAG: hypothetical protein ACREHV_15375 [Rhizomicrobium sp.]